MSAQLLFGGILDIASYRRSSCSPVASYRKSFYLLKSSDQTLQKENLLVIMQYNTKNSGANLRKSTDQLASSSNASSPVIISEISVAVKPKAVRLKPVANHSSETAFKCDESVQATSSKLDDESTEISKEISKNIILYRPIAQVVSSSTLLKKLENYEEHNQTLLDEQFQTQQLNQIAVHQSLSNTNKFHSSPNSANGSKKTQVKSQHTTSNGDRNSLDGYNWRKYGQKQVKGREYPRAYYRCIHPCCPVKKMVERSKDGEINEIVYKGDHNHPKSQKINKTCSSTLREQESVIDGNVRNLRDDLLVNDSSLEVFFENKTDNCDVEGFLDGNNSYVSLSFGADCKGGNDSALCTMDGLEKKSQRRQYDDNTKGCLMVSQKTSIHEVAASIDYNYKNDDGYHWRKYGQKIVKGNSYPRNYYRCTNQNCKARKYVERTTDGPGLFLTTYEGYHKH